MRVIVLLHRYLAVCIGVVMTLWCLSGFVMMYQDYPSFTEEERLRALAPLDLSACCQWDSLPEDDVTAFGTLRVEMLGDSPVLREGSLAIDLRTGEWIDELFEEQILDIARRYAHANGIAAQPRLLGRVELDQWTIQSAYRNQPAYRLAFDDPAATEIYVNGATGEIFQDTRRRERVLAWLGAIPHWLYPTVLRQNGVLWSRVVIWASVIGTFLAATGLYVGLSRLERRRRDGKLASPFRGWWYWHHMFGLTFGVLTLMWVFSGLLTMNPWGLLEGGSASDYRQRLTGEASWGDVKRFFADARVHIGSEFTQLRFGSFNDELYVLAMRHDGTSVRFDASGARADLDDAEVEEAVARLGVPVKSLDLLNEEDSFYYGHKEPVKLPVYRIVLDDAERTRLYLDPTTGALRAFDSAARWSRWIRRGLHGFDFAGIRERPIWDVLVMLMLAGVTAVCVTGTWLALKRVRLDCRRLRVYFPYNSLSTTRQASEQ